jgi:hypothetical protein
MGLDPIGFDINQVGKSGQEIEQELTTDIDQDDKLRER